MQIKMQGIISARKTSHTTTASVVYGNSPGMRVNTMYINSTRGTASKQDGRQWYIYIYMPSISSTLGNTDVYRRKTEPIFIYFIYCVYLCVYTFSQITWLCPVWNKNWFCFTIPHSKTPLLSLSISFRRYVFLP